MRELNVETNLHYATDDSWAFEENFKVLQYSGYSTNAVALYIDYSNNSNEYNVEQDCIIEDTKHNRVMIKRYLTQNGYLYSDLFGTLEEVRDSIGEGVDFNNIEELEGILDDIGVSYTSNYERMTTRGYSQGDYAEILVNTAEYEKVGGAPFNAKIMQKWFDHYFWDSPVYGGIDVSFDYTRNAVNFEYRGEFDVREFLDDEYEVDGLDREQIVEQIKSELVVPLTEAEEAEIVSELNKIDWSYVTY